MSKEKTFEQRKSNQRLTANGYLQNKYMRRASKKDWYSEIAYMRNIFAVRFNPICLESKLGRSIHNMLCHWVTCLWETKMTQSLNEYIFKKEVYNKLDKLQLKENVAINTVHECLSNNNIDEELVTLIKEYHNTYIFVFFSFQYNLLQH